MDVIHIAVVVHVFQPLRHIHGYLHPRNPGAKNHVSRHFATPQAIPEVRSLDVLGDQIYLVSVAAGSQELDYAGVVGIAYLSES